MISYLFSMYNSLSNAKARTFAYHWPNSKLIQVHVIYNIEIKLKEVSKSGYWSSATSIVFI